MGSQSWEGRGALHQDPPAGELGLEGGVWEPQGSPGYGSGLEEIESEGEVGNDWDGREEKIKKYLSFHHKFFFLGTCFGKKILLHFLVSDSRLFLRERDKEYF